MQPSTVVGRASAVTTEDPVGLTRFFSQQTAGSYAAG